MKKFIILLFGILMTLGLVYASNDVLELNLALDKQDYAKILSFNLGKYWESTPHSACTYHFEVYNSFNQKIFQHAFNPRFKYCDFNGECFEDNATIISINIPLSEESKEVRLSKNNITLLNQNISGISCRGWRL